MVDDLGQEIEDRVYNQRDMDKVLVLNERTQLVAEKVVDYLLGVDPYGKTIVFCENIDHAERMRSALVNEVAARVPGEATTADQYVTRITGDSFDGKAQLDNFIHPEKRYPVIATTSKLMTTGVNAKTCKLVVLDQRIQSMIEFKQIDWPRHSNPRRCRQALVQHSRLQKGHRLFADPDFDGEPEVIYEPKKEESVVPVDTDDEGQEETGLEEEPEGTKKYVVSNVAVSVMAERVQYYGPDGRLITESLKDYTRPARQTLRHPGRLFCTMDKGDSRRPSSMSCANRGCSSKPCASRSTPITARLGFGLPRGLRPPLTRKELVSENVKKRDVFARKRQALVDHEALLDKYADEGETVRKTAVCSGSTRFPVWVPRWSWPSCLGVVMAMKRLQKDKLGAELYLCPHRELKWQKKLAQRQAFRANNKSG